MMAQPGTRSNRQLCDWARFCTTQDMRRLPDVELFSAD